MNAHAEVSRVDVLADLGEGRFDVPARLNDVVSSLKFDEKMHGHKPDRSTLDFPHAIEILEAQIARIVEARAAVAELIEACREVSIYSRGGHAASAKRWRAALARLTAEQEAKS